MTSPMRTPEEHDRFVLLDGAKEWVLPGAASVAVSMASNIDEMQTPGDGNTATQLNESTCEVEVSLTMWTHEQWQAYQQVLWRLRQGTKAGKAVFSSAHPEVRARRMKQLYFVSEQPSPYSPKDGYKVKLQFKEKLKEKAKTTELQNGPLVIPGAGGSGGSATAGTGTMTASTKQGQAVYAEAMAQLTGPPRPADGGRANTAQPGYCSAWQRNVGTQAGLPAKMYGGSARATEANFLSAKLAQRWGPDTAANLQLGDQVFWGNDPSGFGHVGTVVGRDKDGMPLIAGNNLVTYKQRGGRFNSAGQAIDRNIDSRGIVRLDQLSTRKSQPTSVARPGGFGKALPVLGPTVPVPAFRPSLVLGAR